MKKVVLASLIAVSSLAPLAQYALAEQPAARDGAPAQAAAGQVQLSQEEYNAYNNAKTQTTPAAQATAFEAYLKAYPNSTIKADVLQQLLFAYSQSNDSTNALGAADRLLAVDPTNFRAYVFEVQLRRQAAEALTDAAARQSGLDAAADYAQKGLAAPKSKDMSDADFTTLKAAGYPIFYSAIGTDALGKKDNAAAISAFKSELGAVPVAQTTSPGLQLQDTFYLAQAYYTSTPPDYVNCAYYGSRAMDYAPEPYKTQFKQVASYCYRKYHGKADGFDDVANVAKDNLTPPSGFTIAPAPSAADIVSNLIATTPDLAALAISDKEYVLQNGKPADADKVFDTVKGKSVEIPGALVIEATAEQLKVAVSDDAVQGKVADFAFNMKEPLKVIPAVGAKVTLSGTYASYSQSPLLIVMNDAAEVKKTATKPAATTHRPATHR